MNPIDHVRRILSTRCWTHAALVCLQTLTVETVQSMNAYKVERNSFIRAFEGQEVCSKREPLSIPLPDKSSRFIHVTVN